VPCPHPTATHHQAFALYAADHWEELYETPDRPASLYEVCQYSEGVGAGAGCRGWVQGLVVGVKDTHVEAAYDNEQAAAQCTLVLIIDPTRHVQGLAGAVNFWLDVADPKHACWPGAEL